MYASSSMVRIINYKLKSRLVLRKDSFGLKITGVQYALALGQLLKKQHCPLQKMIIPLLLERTVCSQKVFELLHLMLIQLLIAKQIFG